MLRIVTPLQSISALFIADIGRYVGHTAAELQEIRAALVILARGARFVLWLAAGVIIAASFGADPLVALSGFGAGTLFIGLALHKSVEDACAVVRKVAVLKIVTRPHARAVDNHSAASVDATWTGFLDLYRFH